MAWVALLVAGLLEIVWAYSMKLSHGFTRPTPTLITLIAMVASFVLLAHAMRVLPLGTAYIIWTGIGAVGAFVLCTVAGMPRLLQPGLADYGCAATTSAS